MDPAESRRGFDPVLWHTLSSETVFTYLKSPPTGLTEVEAVQRLREYGPNELQAPRRISPPTILFEQFKNVLIVMLLAATALSAFLGHEIEAIAIAVIVLFAVLLGFVQEYRAERATEVLRQMTALTAESVPVTKDAAPLTDGEVALGDRRNMAYAGTVATYGRGRAVVVATGMHTEFGKIAQMLQTVETGRTPLQENLDRVGHVLAWAAFVVVAAIVALGLYRGQPFIEMLIFGIALAVAVVPEALPAVVTISLAIGVQRMVKRHALMRRLPAVETLGSTSVICSDKTGTLTKDEMTVRKIFVAGQMLELHSQGGVRRGVRASGSYQEGTGKSGCFATWKHPRGHVWNVVVRPASTRGATGRSGTPSRQSRGVDPPVEIRRVEGAQRKWCRKTSVFLSRETGMPGKIVGAHQGCQV